MPALGLEPAPGATASGSLEALRQAVLVAAQNRPGVYWMSSAEGEVLYVGKSKSLRSRLLSYFRARYPQEKSARIVREVAAIQWTYVPSEFAALLAELRLVKRLRPRLNVALKRDARNYAFVAVTAGRAPKLTVLRGTGGTRVRTVYGPFLGAARLAESLRELSDALGLRDCTFDARMRFADQGEIFELPKRPAGCIRFEVGKCCGPCIAAVTAGEYARRVSLARAFLEGTYSAPLESLQRAMLAASQALQFERAALLRDKLARLQELRDRMEALRCAVEELTFSYHVSGVGGEDRVYLIRRGVVRAEVPAPRSAAEARALVELARSTLRGDAPAPRALPVHEIDEVLLVTSWFRRHPEELRRTKRWL